MKDTWFENDLRTWTNIPGYFPPIEKATIILNLAKERLERNDGHIEPSTGRIGFKDIENKLNKFYERKKLGYVIRILNTYLATGRHELPIQAENFTKKQRVEYKLLTEIIKEALIPRPIVRNIDGT